MIRSKIVSLLREISDPRAIPALVTSLSDPDEGVRDKAKQALISIGSPCYDKVLPLLTHESVQVVSAAIVILPEVNREKGIAAVVPFFKDPRDEVWDAIYDSLIYLDPKPVSEMIAYLDSEGSEILIGALNILVNVGDASLIPLISPLTGHADEYVRDVAEWSIEVLSKERVPPKIIHVL